MNTDLALAMAELPLAGSTGWDSGRRGVRRQDNPHPRRTVARLQWDYGWRLYHLHKRQIRGDAR